MTRRHTAALDRLPMLALVALGALISPLAFAADAPKPAAKAPTKAAAEGSLGKGTGSGPLLTREQLRQCMTTQDRLKQDGTSLVQEQGELGKTRAEIDRLGTEISAELATLDRTSQAAVDAYNAKVRERVKLTEAYQAAAPAFNQRVDKLEADKQGFTKDCGDRRYNEDDFNAIKAGK